jgi:tetratricopeptide (TPR) repeat protein
MFARDYDKAVEQARITPDMYPDSLHACWVLGWSEIGRGRLRDAISAFDRALTLSRDNVSLAYFGLEQRDRREPAIRPRGERRGARPPHAAGRPCSPT